MVAAFSAWSGAATGRPPKMENDNDAFEKVSDKITEKPLPRVKGFRVLHLSFIRLHTYTKVSHNYDKSK
jgi:hypothetical protein